MANQYRWDDGTKLAKLVEALEGKALNYYGTLDEVIRGNYRLVRQKFNACFFPREPARTEGVYPPGSSEYTEDS